MIQENCKEKKSFESRQNSWAEKKKKQNLCGGIVQGKDQEVGTYMACLESLKRPL